MAVFDSNYQFTFSSIVDSGRESDVSVFAASDIGKAINKGSLNIFSPCDLSGSDLNSSYVVVGDKAFPRKTNLVKPYSSVKLDELIQFQII